MSLARRHRDRILAAQTVIAAGAPVSGAAFAPAADPLPAAGAANASPADRAAAQIALRLTHDLRRLKKIKSVAHKVEAKRQMFPEYRDWLVGLVTADAGIGTGVAAEVAPTMMVWMIDIGLFADAANIGEFLLRHNAAMPARYNRDVATVLVEETADAALKLQAAGSRFDLAVLDQVEGLTHHLDMHDEVRAKLRKALGTERLARAEGDEMTAGHGRVIEAALDDLRGAQALHDRIGVKDKIKRAEKLLAAHAAAFPPATEQSGDASQDAVA